MSEALVAGQEPADPPPGDLERLMAALERLADPVGGGGFLKQALEGLALALGAHEAVLVERQCSSPDLRVRARSKDGPLPPSWSHGLDLDHPGLARGLVLEDLSVAPGWGQGPTDQARGSALLLPLTNDGECAILVWLHPEPGHLGPGHLEQARRAGVLARTVLGRWRLEQALRDEARFKRAVLDTIGSIVVIMDTHGVIIDVNPATCEVMGYGRDEVVGHHFGDFFVEDEGESVWAIFERMVKGGPRATHESAWRGKDGLPHWMALSNTVIRDEGGAVQYVMATGIDVSQRRSMERRLRFSALHDSLTGLANRAAFQEHLGELARRTEADPEFGFTLLYLDLDGFKDINDTRGHAAGDRALVEVGRRLRDMVRRHDLVARLGGDEFAVLLDGVVQESGWAPVVERIRESICTPIDVSEVGQQGAWMVSVGVSVGVVVGTRGRSNMEALLRAADQAMYVEKASHR